MGVLFKGGAARWPGRIRTLAFDKTGTLTHGRPEVESIVRMADLKRGSGDCGRSRAWLDPPDRQRDPESNTRSVPSSIRHLTLVPGQGMTGELDGRTYSWFPGARRSCSRQDEQAWTRLRPLVRDGFGGGRSSAIGLIVLADSVRPISGQVIEELCLWESIRSCFRATVCRLCSSWLGRLGSASLRRV